MILDYILFAIGFVILIKGADLMVDGASAVAKKLKMSNIVIGLTIVAFGTSAPEFIVNIFASNEGSAGLALGNIIGSNIANILLILGVTAIIYPVVVKKNTIYREIPFSFLAAAMLFVLANDRLLDNESSSKISLSDGLVFLGFFIVFLYYVFSVFKSDKEDYDETENSNYDMPLFKAVVFILLGITGLFFGGKWIVDGAKLIAQSFNMTENVIGLTVVALGTSLPELATSAVAAYKKNTDIAMGNVIGSNIFNIFWVLGCSSIIKPLPVSSSTNFDLIVLLIVSLILLMAMFVGKKYKLQKWQGIGFLAMYFTYIAYLVIK